MDVFQPSNEMQLSELQQQDELQMRFFEQQSGKQIQIMRQTQKRQKSSGDAMYRLVSAETKGKNPISKR